MPLRSVMIFAKRRSAKTSEQRPLIVSLYLAAFSPFPSAPQHLEAQRLAREARDQEGAFLGLPDPQADAIANRGLECCCERGLTPGVPVAKVRRSNGVAQALAGVQGRVHHPTGT